MGKSIVSIVKGNDIEKMVTEALFHLGGVKKLIRPKSTVVIKPNAGHLNGPDTSVNTNPDVVAAVIKEIRKANPKEIILAESAAIGCDTMECLEISGIKKAAEEAGLDKIIDIKKEKDLIKVPVRDGKSDIARFRLPRFLIEADHIVNVPIFKSHCSMIFTCALKNLKGVVQDKAHYQMHQTNLAEAMLDLWTVIKPDLMIADLIRPAEGFGPHYAVPVDFGCIAASKDPVALDATICRMIGLDIEKVHFFEPAKERAIGNYEESLIDIKGNSIKEVFKGLWQPHLEGMDISGEYSINSENACSSCLSLIGLAMEKLKSLDEYENNKDANIFIGRKKEIPEGIPPERIVLMGDCLKRWRNKGIFVGGCPPIEDHPHWAIIDRKPAEGDVEDWRKRQANEMESFMRHMYRLKEEWENSRIGM